MKDSHKGFVGNSGVQSHSAGCDFPITHYCVGGFPDGFNGCYWVVQHPCGAKRRAWTTVEREHVIESFKNANEAIGDLDCNVVSERIAFELALNAELTKGNFTGFLIED